MIIITTTLVIAIIGLVVGAGLVYTGKKFYVEVDEREAVAELKDKYCTHCVVCGKPWGAGALHVLHRITFHGRFVTNLYTCCDCNAKIGCGVI